MLRESRDQAVIDVLKSGELVSDELTYEVFDTAIKDADANEFKQIIVDGFPRTKEQAEWLKTYTETSGRTVKLVVVFEVPEEEIMSRLELRGRMEDTPETIAKRMNIYRQKMYPVLGSFAEDGIKIVHLDGTGTAGEVHDRLYETVMNGLESRQQWHSRLKLLHKSTRCAKAVRYSLGYYVTFEKKSRLA